MWLESGHGLFIPARRQIRPNNVEALSRFICAADITQRPENLLLFGAAAAAQVERAAGEFFPLAQRGIADSV
jgi:hypothetical protein